jgi:hypothetical protein
VTAPPRARELQGGGNGADDVLTLRARAGHGRRVHWWGRRTRDGRTGAWCYLCAEFICTWSGGYPITEAARAAIRQHRTMHIQLSLHDSTANHRSEK